MRKNITRLGPKEAEFLSLISSGGGQFTIERAAEFWGSKAKAGKKLHELEKRAWVERLERGKYLVIPLEAGIERTWSEDPYVIASTLVHPAAIAFWSAIRHWNWTEQIPRIVYIQTTTRKFRNQRTVFGVQYQFVTVPQGKFYGHVTEWVKGKPVLITDKEKTLIDCADDVARAGSIEELTKAVQRAISEISWPKLDSYVRRFPNRSAIKRLGFLIESLHRALPEEGRRIVDTWPSLLSAGVVLLQSGGRVAGRISTRWRVRINAEVV